MSSLSDLYVMLPAYNEGPVIGEVIAVLQAQGPAGILVVDDGSCDGTARLASERGALVARHSINRGAGAAVQTGIAIARQKGWPLLAMMDADGQHEASDLRKLKSKMQETGADLVIGSRFMQRQDGIPTDRRLFNRIANFLTNRLTRRRYTDTQSGLRLLNRAAIEAIELQVDGFGFCSEMVVLAERAGLTIAETPTRVHYTDYSTSKGQDLHVGVHTAFNFLWKTLFK